MSTCPFVSVVIPVYNARRTIKLCLDALLAQDYPRSQYEVIAVDNNSTDDSIQIIAGYMQVKLLRETATQGSYAARNLGISQARGEIVAFTDSDCLALPDWLSQLTSRFADSKVLAVGGQLKPPEPTNMVERFLAEVSGFHGNYQERGEQLFPPLLTGNSAYRKQVLLELGGFDALLFTGGDVDLAWRLQHRFGLCTRFNPEAVVLHYHYATLKGMYYQYRRHGTGEIYLDALYYHYPGYPRNLRYQMARIGSQSWALVKYMVSFVYRGLKYPSKRDRYYILRPVLLFVAEWANLTGKFKGLRETHLLRSAPGNPALRNW